MVVNKVYKNPVGANEESDLKKLFKEETGLDFDEAVPGKDGKFISKEEKKKSKKKDVIVEEYSEFTEKEEKKVSKKEMDKKISELNEKIDKLNEKNKKLAEDRDKYKKSSDSFEKQFKDKEKEYDKLEKKYESLSVEKDQLDMDIRELKKEKVPAVVEDGETINKLKGEISGLKKEKKTAEENCEKSEKKIAELEEKIDRLETENGELRKSVPEEKPSDGTVERATATDFKSNLFKEGTYVVNLATDLSKLTFKFDIMGKAKCEKKTIRIPAMAKYLSFVRSVEYQAVVKDDGTIEIKL